MRVWEWRQGQDQLIYHQQLNSERPIFPSFSALMQYVVPEDREQVMQIRTRCFEQGLPVQLEFRIVLPDGNQRWLFALGQPYWDEAGTVIGIIGVTQDITDRKESEERGLELALQKERISLMTEFLGNISHDMKTPLSVMNTSLYLLEQLDEPEQRARKIETIREQAALMERFIQDMLTISRLDYAPTWDMQPVDLNGVLRTIQAQLQPTAEHNELSLVLDLDVNLPPTVGDHDELNRMLVNLIENAVQYTPAHGSVMVQTGFDDDAIRVEISDTGIGINENELPMIFGRFYRADSARKSRKNGTGLGLAIVKRIVEIHQGEITVNSEVGRGTTFLLRLPVAPVTTPV
jgi:two-component system phosphate regulon sensor histidine kinase PhoR